MQQGNPTNFPTFTTLAAANNLAPDLKGNSGVVTGNTQINLLSTTGRPAGTIVSLVFTGTPTIKHGQTTSGANQTILLQGVADLTADTDVTLTLYNDGTSWQEIGRKTLTTSGGSLIDVQVYTTSSQSPWTKPSGAKRVHVEVIGGGGGGGGGGDAGGSGGGGGVIIERWFDASHLSSSENFVVGDEVGPAAALAAGSVGSYSSFGTVVFVKAWGGGGGAAADNGGGGGAGTHGVGAVGSGATGGTGGGGLTGTPSAQNSTQWGNGGGGGSASNGGAASGIGGGGGGASAATTGNPGGTSLYGGGGGGGGGTGTNSGGAGGKSGGAAAGATGGGGTAGTGGGAGGAGATATSTGASGSGGGGGGGAAVTGGAGGDGGAPGGGGGGGGRGGTTGGAGGKGARGEIRVTTYG